VQIGTGQIVTGPDGKQVAGAGATLTLTPAWGDGAAAGNIAVDLSKITAVAGESSFSNVTANGFRGGVVKSVGFNEAGVLAATLDSGEIVTVADLALADFQSPDGLERIGDNLFIETTESGTATVAKAGTEGLGSIKGNSLESSTVDAANEFVKMIQIQQGYRAGSQVVQAVNELLTATIQIA
jgi:flagellar hook protein FlgE